jgi:uncharacterized membrane protein
MCPFHFFLSLSFLLVRMKLCFQIAAQGQILLYIYFFVVLFFLCYHLRDTMGEKKEKQLILYMIMHCYQVIDPGNLGIHIN